MNGIQRARMIIDEYVESNGIDHEMTSADIKIMVEKKLAEMNSPSKGIQPMDICYNAYNDGFKKCFEDGNRCLIYNIYNKNFRIVGSKYKYDGPVYQYITRDTRKIVGKWVDGSFIFINQSIEKLRDVLTEELRKKLMDLRITVRENYVDITINKEQVVTVIILDECFKIKGISEEWKKITTYTCNEDEDSYFVDTIDECIGEIVRINDSNKDS